MSWIQTFGICVSRRETFHKLHVERARIWDPTNVWERCESGALSGHGSRVCSRSTG